MKEYKVESFIYNPQLSLDTERILKTSSAEIQEKLDEYAQNGWRLVSTDSTGFGVALYVYLYFERDKA